MTCDNTTNQCIAAPAVCFASLGAIIGALAAGVIAAIIIACLFAAMLAGGAVYAVNGQIHQHRDAEVLNNPLYMESACKGENPLFEYKI